MRYYAKCPECGDMWEKSRNLYERVSDHGGKGKKSHVLKHSYKKHIQMILLKIVRY